MISIDPGGTFDSWRESARRLLASRVPPEEVLWEKGLFDSSPPSPPEAAAAVRVPSDFPELAKHVACHCDPVKWPLLYRILWRATIGGERHLLRVASDRDVSKALVMAKSVRREIHKMHAFVRFRLISTDDDGRERYAAWFEPDHFIVAAGTPFFRDRFANMDWSIFTPKGSAHWIDRLFTLGPAIAVNPIDRPDALEEAWSVYYRSIFNPARVNPRMMRTEMPRRYWKNMPETSAIRDLIQNSLPKVGGMLANATTPPRPAPALPYLSRLRALDAAAPVISIPRDASLKDLAKDAARCRACPLWEKATCTVFGEGREDARIMIVGEQPGDKEDLAGRVFVGPAGKLLDRALSEAGIDRGAAYLTNAVKHFKWTPRGKIRLHQKPDSTEIEACRPWVLGELHHIRPDVLILLGSTAARSLLGRAVQVTKERGIIEAQHLAPRVILTVHPSYLLRIPEETRKNEEYGAFVTDLKRARL